MDDFDDMDALTAPAKPSGDERPPLTFEAALHQDYDSEDTDDDEVEPAAEVSHNSPPLRDGTECALLRRSQ
jgi:hypothetical protein